MPTESARLHPLYETGRLDLTEQESGDEESRIYDAVMTRHPRIAHPYFWHQTPQEIHRIRVISAMRMAHSCLVYGEEWRWRENYSKEYTGIKFFDNGLHGESTPKYRMGTKAQRDAYALTKAEVDAVWEAQKELLTHYRVRRNVWTDGEGVTYNSVERID